VRSKEEWLKLAREEEGDPTTGVDDRPVDVRLALALGCECVFKTWLARDENVSAWMCLDGHHRGSRLGSDVRFTGELHHYSSDYAWCGEVQHLNCLDVRAEESERTSGPDWVAYHPYWPDLRSLSDDWRKVICEWVIAAIAAGVTVRLPGGRVING
jgi:hypothetical protein